MPRPTSRNGITELGPGRWRWRVMVDGVRLSGIAPTQAAAKLARAHAEIDAGGAPTHDPTVAELLDGHIGDSDRAHTTKESWRWAYDCLPEPFLARRARDVDAQIVAGLWRQLRTQPPHRLVKVANLCSTAWQDALTLGVVASNPWRVIAPPTPPPRTDIAPPDPADVRALIDAADPWFRLWLLIATQTGARGGEVCALQWDDLDPVSGEVLIRRNITRAGELRATKTGVKGQRRVPLDDDALDLWTEAKERATWLDSGSSTNGSTVTSTSPAPKSSGTSETTTSPSSTSSATTNSTPSSGRSLRASQTHISTSTSTTALPSAPSSPASPWVFTREDGEPMRPDGAAKRLERLCRLVGVDVSPHDLRHFAVTQWLAVGEPIPNVAAMIGDNPKTVMQTYAHHIPTQRRDMVRRLAKLIREA